MLLSGFADMFKQISWITIWLWLSLIFNLAFSFVLVVWSEQYLLHLMFSVQFVQLYLLLNLLLLLLLLFMREHWVSVGSWHSWAKTLTNSILQSESFPLATYLLTEAGYLLLLHVILMHLWSFHIARWTEKRVFSDLVFLDQLLLLTMTHDQIDWIQVLRWWQWRLRLTEIRRWISFLLCLALSLILTRKIRSKKLILQFILLLNFIECRKLSALLLHLR